MARILFQNPHGLGTITSGNQEQSLKITKLKAAILNHNIDVVGLSEVNKDWRQIPHQESFWALTEGWVKHRRLITSINRKVESQSSIQYGGTLLMATNKLAYSIIKTEEDSQKLGRWCSILLRGKKTL
jgi:hypothetical protein